MALIPPFFLDCVVAIGFPGSAGKAEYAATGFLYGQALEQYAPDEKLYRVFLVTNRHVLADKRVAHLRFNPVADADARVFDAPLVDATSTPSWHGHPDQDVDVAILNLNVRLLQEQGIRFSYFRSNEHVLDRKTALDLGLSEGDAVFVLGFPLGVVGERRNFVIVRQGIIARVRDALAGQSKEFLLDSGIFPGNSGGPVVLSPEVVSIEGTTAIGKAYLLAVVAGYLPYRDVAISAQTKQIRVIFQENSGLAAAYPVDFVNELIESLPPPTDEDLKRLKAEQPADT